MVRRKSTQRQPSRLSSKTSIRSTKTEVLVSKRRKLLALKEIKHLQKTTKLIIPKKSFARLVKEIIQDMFPRSEVDRIQSTALQALQESCESYLVQFFEDALLLAIHAKRVTLMLPDMRLVRRLRGRGDVINR